MQGILQLVADVYKLASRVFASVTNHFVAFAAFDAASDTVAVYETARARGTTVVIPPASVVSHRQMRILSVSIVRASHDSCNNGIVKLRLTAVSDPQHGGFTAGSSPVSWGSLDELFVNLTVSMIPRA